MFASVRKAFAVIFDPAFRGLALRAALLTLLLFVAALGAAEVLIARLPVLGDPLVNQALALLAPVLFVFLLGALGGPVTALFGGMFLDRLAAGIEARAYPWMPSRPGHFLPSLKAGLRLSALVLGADLLLLPLDIGVPGLGELASLLVNGWLLGWEYFELAALRHLPVGEADALRRAHGGRIWLGGILISCLSVVPVADLAAPLFGTALMVHLFQEIRGKQTAS